MSAKEAAKYLGISYGLILEMVKRNQINAIHASSRVLFRKETIDNWMHNQEMQSTQTVAKPTENTAYGTLRISLIMWK